MLKLKDAHLLHPEPDEHPTPKAGSHPSSAKLYGIEWRLKGPGPKEERGWVRLRRLGYTSSTARDQALEAKQKRNAHSGSHVEYRKARDPT